MQVSVRELKNRLSEYLRRVESGENVTVTRRGRVIAALVPAEPASDPEAASLERLRRLPWVRPASGGRPHASQRPMSWQPGDKLLSELVIEDRR
jgi:prevent-host-death family protein